MHTSTALTLHQLQVLVAVADHGGFAEAALDLGTSQPNVSAAVLSAERQLGFSLFARRPVAPTLRCKRLLPYARSIVEQEQLLEEQIRQASAMPRQLRCAMPETLYLAYASMLEECWRKGFPELEIELIEGEDDEIRQWLRSGFVHAGVLVDPAPGEVGEQPASLFEDELVGVIRGDHPLADQASIELDDLLDDELALSNSGCLHEIETLCRNVRPAFRPRLLVRDMKALLAVVKSGTAVTILPSTCERILPDGVRMIGLRPAVARRLVATMRPGLPESYRLLFRQLVGILREIRSQAAA